jgi:integrase
VLFRSVVPAWFHDFKESGFVSMRISASTIKNVPIEDHEYVIWDSELSGFGLRVYPTGEQRFVVKYRVGRGRLAKQRRTSLGSPGNPFTAHEARQRASAILSEARLGHDPAEAMRVLAAEAMTVNGFLDLWEIEAAPFDRRSGKRRKEASVKGDIRRVNIHVRPNIGKLRLSELTSDHLKKLRRDIAEGKTARTVKTKARGVSRATGGDGTAINTLRILKSAFGYAVEKGLLDANPVSRLKLPPTNMKERYLSRDELQRLGTALDSYESQGGNPHAANIVRLLALTGARRGEIERLTWRSIDFDHGTALLSDTKTGRVAWPLSQPALILLEGLRNAPSSQWVFPASSGDKHYQGLNRAWPEIRAGAKLDDVRLHDLRHSFASIGAASGMGLQIVGKLLGHRQASTTARYSHLGDDPLRSAADRIGGEIAGLMEADHGLE